LCLQHLRGESISVAAKEIRGGTCWRERDGEKCEEFVAVGRSARRLGTVRKGPSFPTGLESVIPTESGSAIIRVGRAGGECADLTRRLYHIGNVCQGLL